MESFGRRDMKSAVTVNSISTHPLSSYYVMEKTVSNAIFTSTMAMDNTHNGRWFRLVYISAM